MFKCSDDISNCPCGQAECISTHPDTKVTMITGYNQSVTGCGSPRRHEVVTQRKLM